MSKGLSNGFFDQSNVADDSVEVISGSDQEDSNIPYLEDEDEDEEEEAPKPKSKKSAKSKVEVEEEEEEDDEEELEEEEEDEDEEESDESEDEDEEETQIEKFGMSLIERGVLIPDEDKEYDPTENGLAELVEDSIEFKLKERVKPGYESILAAMEMDMPVEDWLSLVQPEEDYENADLTDLKTQKILISRNLQFQGLTKEQIDKKIARYEKLDQLEEEAEEAQTLLVQRDGQRVANNNTAVLKEREDRQKVQKETLDNIRKEIYNTKEISEMFISKKEQKELDDYLTKPVNTKGQTQYMIDRNDPKKIVKAGFFLKNDIDASKLSKVAKSKITNQVKRELDQRTDRNTSTKGRQNRESIRIQGQVSLPWDIESTNEVTD